MNITNLYKKKFFLFIFSILIFFVVTFILNRHNDRFSLPDFRVYYKAAEAFSQNLPFYHINFLENNGEYKYSPFILTIFLFFTKLSYETACVVQFSIISIAMLSLFLLLFKIINDSYFLKEKKDNIFHQNLLLIILTISSIKYTTRELNLGNINIIILLFLTIFILMKNKGYKFLPSLFLAFVTSAKPFFFVLFIPLILSKNIRIIVMTILFFLTLEFLPSFFVGISKNIALHRQWLDVMTNHSQFYDSKQTIFAILKTYLPFYLPNYLNYIIFVFMISLYTLLFYPGLKNQRQSHFTFSWFVLIALIPNLFPNDFVQFLNSIPLILICLCFLFFSKSKHSIPLKIFFIFTIIAYDINMSDLTNAIYPGLTALYEAKGLIGISNLLLVSLSIFIYFKYLYKQKEFLISHQENRTPT